MRNPLEAVPIAVALITNSEERGKRLQAALHAGGVDVYQYDDSSPDVLPQITATRAAAIMVDLDGGSDRCQALIDALVRQDVLPVLFNDGSGLGAADDPATDGELGEKLKIKLGALVSGKRPAHEWVTARDEIPQVTVLDTGRDEAGPDAGWEHTHAAVIPRRDAARPAERVWVLGASLGGPDAIKRFIGRVPAEIPAAFILAQHISGECIPLLMNQLRRVTALKVMSARGGHLLQHGQLLVAPVDRHLGFDEAGRIQLDPEGGDEEGASASIDSVMTSVAGRYGDRAGAIVFSGIGNDGVLGARSILDGGGTVWAQAADSCIMASMPNHVRNACPVALNGCPEELAEYLVNRLIEAAASYASSYNQL